MEAEAESKAASLGHSKGSAKDLQVDIGESEVRTKDPKLNSAPKRNAYVVLW